MFRRQSLRNPYAIFMRLGLDFAMPESNEMRRVADIEKKPPVHPGASALRKALQRNIVSFPSQVPIFLKQPSAEMQWRAVTLFFVRGWSTPAIAARFGAPAHQILQIANDWSKRALALGYIQVIDATAFDEICRLDEYEGPPKPVTPLKTMRPEPVPFATAVVPPPAEKPVSARAGDLLASLDTAIKRCEEWDEPFWARAAMLLHDIKNAAQAAIDLQNPHAVA